MKSGLILSATSAAIVCAAPMLKGAEPTKIFDLRIQVVNGKSYFHVRLQRPMDYLAEAPSFNRRFNPWSMQGTDPRMQLRLVPQDEGARLIYPDVLRP